MLLTSGPGRVATRGLGPPHRQEHSPCDLGSLSRFSGQRSRGPDLRGEREGMPELWEQASAKRSSALRTQAGGGLDRTVCLWVPHRVSHPGLYHLKPCLSLKRSLPGTKLGRAQSGAMGVGPQRWGVEVRTLLSYEALKPPT